MIQHLLSRIIDEKEIIQMNQYTYYRNDMIQKSLRDYCLKYLKCTKKYKHTKNAAYVCLIFSHQQAM